MNSLQFHHLQKSLDSRTYGEIIIEVELRLFSEQFMPLNQRVYDFMISTNEYSHQLLILIDILISLRDRRYETFESLHKNKIVSPLQTSFAYLKCLIRMFRFVFQTMIQFDVMKNLHSDEFSAASKTAVLPKLHTIQDIFSVLLFSHSKSFIQHFSGTPEVQVICEDPIVAQILHHTGPRFGPIEDQLLEKLHVLSKEYEKSCENLMCLVCLENFQQDDVAILDACSHIVCGSCAEVLFMGSTAEEEGMPSTQKMKRCPACRGHVEIWTTAPIAKFYLENKKSLFALEPSEEHIPDNWQTFDDVINAAFLYSCPSYRLFWISFLWQILTTTAELEEESDVWRLQVSMEKVQHQMQQITSNSNSESIVWANLSSRSLSNFMYNIGRICDQQNYSLAVKQKLNDTISSLKELIDNYITCFI